MSKYYVLMNEDTHSYAASITKNYIGWLSDISQALEFDSMDLARNMKNWCEGKFEESNIEVYEISFEIEKAN